MSGDTIKNAIREYCSEIGTDSLLVQGAGGNASWKENNVLWVKASGTWLAEANEKDIFVPVDLAHIRHALNNGDFSVTPKVCGEYSLRPSIETVLHALLPQKIVVHLHAIEVLAHLVRHQCEVEFRHLLNETIPWVLVDYHKPGAPLAAAISAALLKNPNAKIILMKNHGVVVGAENIVEVKKIIEKLTQTFSVKLTNTFLSSTAVPRHHAYHKIDDVGIQQLALNAKLFTRLQNDWVLYPDHVVFLGPKAYTYSQWPSFQEENLPELIFIANDGVYATSSFGRAKQVQLRCYYDVLSRQETSTALNTLTHAQIAELLNWDAEQYRINLAKQ